MGSRRAANGKEADLSIAHTGPYLVNMNEHDLCDPCGPCVVHMAERDDTCWFCGVTSVLCRTRLIQTTSALDAAPSAERPKGLKLGVVSCKWTSGFEVRWPRLALFGFLQNILKDHDKVEGILPF